MQYTTNYNLKKPNPNDFYNVEDLNENMDIIDAELKNTNIDHIVPLDPQPMSWIEASTPDDYPFGVSVTPVLDLQELVITHKVNSSDIYGLCFQRYVRNQHGRDRYRKNSRGNGNWIGWSSWFNVDPDIATKAEAEAGEINSRFMTPLRTKQAIEALSAPATITDTVTGKEYRWGIENGLTFLEEVEE